jgi:hypothetical protein
MRGKAVARSNQLRVRALPIAIAATVDGYRSKTWARTVA